MQVTHFLQDENTEHAIKAAPNRMVTFFMGLFVLGFNEFDEWELLEHECQKK